MITGQCNKSYCYVAQGVECDDGLVTINCPHFQPTDDAPAKDKATGDEALFFWTGEALGLRDLTRIAARNRVLTLALLGPSDAGKTSFLTTLYFTLLSGKSPAGRSFSGSFTLGRWEALAIRMRWSGTQEPGFPDHTPRGAARAPGLLHLAFRDEGGLLTDVLLADAPGEWFERWAVNRNDPAAEGARWLEEHADAALVFLDSEGLSNLESRGQARTQTIQLLTRVTSAYEGRPWRALWAKHDRFEANPVTQVIDDYLVTVGHADTLEAVSANATTDSRGVMEALEWLIGQAHEGCQLTLSTTPVTSADGFLTFRGRPE